jgi:hypothetical protein
MKEMVVVGEVLVDYLTDNHYGEVVAAKLEIRGYLTSFTFENMVACSSSCAGTHGFRLKGAGGWRNISCTRVALSIDVEGGDL